MPIRFTIRGEQQSPDPLATSRLLLARSRSTAELSRLVLAGTHEAIATSIGLIQRTDRLLFALDKLLCPQPIAHKRYNTHNM